ncbi:MAG: sulfatase-like hydrolase/transferase, partial [Opitutae bacterium]
DKLASEGFQYLNCFANAPVCAPSRSGWITGIHPVTLGTLPMRSRYDIVHDQIKYYPDYLKAAGYYCSNVRKTDYNIGGRPDNQCWDSTKIDWKKLKQAQPFMQIINVASSHESRAFGEVDNTSHSPENIKLAKYHPDIPTIRKNYAHYHDAVKRMDAEVGQFLKQLEEQGLAENTIVIYNSDHGGVLPRSKRFLFNSGTHCPLIIRIPEKFKSLRPAEKVGAKIDRLVSFIDMPKTWVSLAGAEVPKIMQGKIFLGPDSELERNYHFSYRERMDERCDNQRAVRDKRYLYIRNYMPYVPWGQKLTYLWKMEATRAWEDWHRKGKTDEVTGRWFGTKPVEELYDTWEDPDNVVNLIDDPAYQKIADELRGALKNWQLEVGDCGLLPECERVKRAEDLGITLYEMAQNVKHYDIKAYLGASELALRVKPEQISALLEMLSHQDSGIRYWGMTGLCLLGENARSDIPSIHKLTNDSSDAVRAITAFTLFRLGEKEAARTCYLKLLNNDSYASLLVLNMIDWLGDKGEHYTEAIRQCSFSHQGYVENMKQFF